MLFVKRSSVQILIGCSLVLILLTQVSVDEVKREHLVKSQSHKSKSSLSNTREKILVNECQRLREQGKLREPFLIEQNFLTLKRFFNILWGKPFDIQWIMKFLLTSPSFLSTVHFPFARHNLTWCPVYKAGSSNWMRNFALLGDMDITKNQSWVSDFIAFVLNQSSHQLC